MCAYSSVLCCVCVQLCVVLCCAYSSVVCCVMCVRAALWFVVLYVCIFTLVISVSHSEVLRGMSIQCFLRKCHKHTSIHFQCIHYETHL